MEAPASVEAVEELRVQLAALLGPSNSGKRKRLRKQIAKRESSTGTVGIGSPPPTEAPRHTTGTACDNGGGSATAAGTTAVAAESIEPTANETSQNLDVLKARLASLAGSENGGKRKRLRKRIAGLAGTIAFTTDLAAADAANVADGAATAVQEEGKQSLETLLARMAILTGYG
jgi:hypothetical protein